MGDAEEEPEKERERDCDADESELFPDYGENEVRMLLGKKRESLLRPFRKSLAKETTGSDRIGDFKIKLATGPTYTCYYDEKKLIWNTPT